MAKFILGNRVRKAAAEREWLSKLLWFFDLVLIGGIVKGLGLLPVDKASAAGRWFASRLGPLMSRKSKKIRDNLSLAFPDKPAKELDKLVAEIWGSSGAVLAEYSHLDFLSNPANRRFQVEIRQPVETYTDPTRPAVFVTAHLSNWEVVAAAIASFGVKFISLYSPPHNPWLDQMLKTSRQALGCELLPRDVTMRPLVRAIAEKRSVAMVADRRIDEGDPVPFFGRDKLSTLLPARLALKYNCPLIPIQAVRTSGANFRIIFHPPVIPKDPEASESDQALDMITQVHQHFEQWIEEAPGEWFCTKRMWAKEKK